ncbi:MAG: hypothetical protein M3406_09265, partial [Chloroflexota bacterium]|nr:hypothetical protein [Chloroflexota bacterium]
MRTRAWLLVVVVALAGGSASPGPTVAQDEVTVDEFAARLTNARELADRGTDDPSAERMASVRGELGLPVHVLVQGGTVEIVADPLSGLHGTSPA